MSTLSKIGIFCVFLLVYAAWLFANYKLMQFIVTAILKQRSYLIATLGASISSIAGVFIFVWLLSGFLDWRFLGLLVAGQVLSIALTALYWAISGSSKTTWGPYIYLEGTIVAERYQWSKWLDILVGVISIFGFPIAAAWVYFTSEVPSEDATLRIFQVMIVALFFIGWISMVKTQILLLSSPTMNDAARDRLLVGQLGGFITWALMFSMILWAFGLGQQRSLPLGTLIPVNLSPSIIGALVALLLLAYVIPYMIGVRRGNTLRESSNQETEKILQGVVETLKLPRAVSAKANELTNLQAQIETQVGKIRSTFPQASAETWETLPGDSTLKLAYDQLRPQDSWIQHVEYLKKLSADLSDVKTALIQPDAESMKSAHEVFEARLQQLRETGKSKESLKIAIGIATVVSTVATALVSQLGQLLVARVQEVAAKLSALDYLIAFLA